MEEPKKSGREEHVDNFSLPNFAAENEDISDNMTSDGSNGNENRCSYKKKGTRPRAMTI